MKNAAEWFFSQVFTDEAIKPKQPDPSRKLPSLLRTARSLEGSWQSRDAIFLKQARLLSDFEDDFPYAGTLTRYYPTYQSLTDEELRGYFTWRTRLRRGEVEKAPLTFAFLYIYELLNQVGALSAQDGYEKLLFFRDAYGALDDGILPYLNRWLRDYVVYYGLDAALLADTPQAVKDRSIAVLDNIQRESPAAIMAALDQLPLRWLKRSKFYQQHTREMDAVIVPVLRRVAEHCDTRCKRGFTAQYFGGLKKDFTWLFDAAVFCDPLRRTDYQYALDSYTTYRCQNGRWMVEGFVFEPYMCNKMDDLLKAIDCALRMRLDPKHPIKNPLDTKWILKIIQEETDSFLAAQKAAEEKKIRLDSSQLAKIRYDAAITQEKLAIEDELEPEEPVLKEPEPPVEVPQPSAPDTPLSPTEYRLLQCLLYGASTGWVRSQGLLMSVLLDAINEKLYEQFQDTVLDDDGQLIPDYIDDLKEMVQP